MLQCVSVPSRAQGRLISLIPTLHKSNDFEVDSTHSPMNQISTHGSNLFTTDAASAAIFLNTAFGSV